MAVKEFDAKNAAAELEAYRARKDTRMASAWMPTPGTTFKGEVIGLRMGGSLEEEGGYGFYPVIVYKDLTDQSVKAVHAFHAVLRQKLADLKTAIGSVQYVTYEGERVTNATTALPAEKQVRYHLYDVENFGEETPAVEENFTF